ncbi:alpha/beta hydrolase family esterase [Gloeobacter morelensis]|uniref:Esterase n=1 Tax=Gloeobacter morelensis MG652769 TaxID=2781736 RepID=A0ABY3PSJ1_9CYAN|nr:PHB depolymerase family esterase [Gloeobacter morelensis]UFP96414.1 hypothetical protein ISF26_09470 [Gloeobacter morelensis MG652769]
MAKILGTPFPVQGFDDRVYFLALPELLPAAPMPLLLFQHGSGAAATDFLITDKQLDRFADANGCLVVAPAGGIPDTRFHPQGKTWDHYKLMGGVDKSTHKEVAFLSALLDTVRTHFPIDINRLYAMGHSAGTAMTSTLMGAGLAKRFAGFGHLKGLSPHGEPPIPGQMPPAEEVQDYRNHDPDGFIATVVMRGKRENQDVFGPARDVQDGFTRDYWVSFNGCTGQEPPVSETVSGVGYIKTLFTGGKAPVFFVEVTSPNDVAEHSLTFEQVQYAYDQLKGFSLTGRPDRAADVVSAQVSGQDVVTSTVPG